MRQYKSITLVAVFLIFIVSAWSIHAQENTLYKSFCNKLHICSAVKQISKAGKYWYQHYSWLDKLTFEPFFLTRIRLTLLIESALEKASFRSTALSIEKTIYNLPNFFHTTSSFHLIFLDKNKKID